MSVDNFKAGLQKVKEYVDGKVPTLPITVAKTNVENTFTAKQTFQDVQINGNLTAKGTTTTVDVKNLDVEQQLITVAKGNTAALTSPAGIKAEKYDGTKDGALVFDNSGTAMVGDVVLDENGNIDEAQSDLQDLATRAKPSELTDGHLLKWDAANKKIVDGGADAGGIKANVENTFTATQTFNGTESQAGIKTNAIDNENGNRVVYFNGTKQMFGSGAIPTQVRTSEQRLKLERPVSGGTGTEIVEVANVSDIGTGGVVIKRKKFTAKVSDGTLLLDNKANIVLAESKNWTTVERVMQTNERFVSPVALGLDLQVGEVYTLTAGETTYTATCRFFTASYVPTGETDLVTFGTGGQAKMLEFTIGARKLRIVDCAVPYGYDELTSPDVAYDGGQVKEAVAAMAFWDDLSSTAISGELTLKTSSYGNVRITDADITSESFVWFETEGTYASASSGSANFYYAVDVNVAQIKIVTYDIITGMGAGAACEQQTLPKVVNVCIAPSGWTENKIDSPTQGTVPSKFYYSKPNLVYKDTAGVVAASTAGIEIYQTQACPTKFGVKRTSENETIWAAVRFD